MRIVLVITVVLFLVTMSDIICVVILTFPLCYFSRTWYYMLAIGCLCLVLDFINKLYIHRYNITFTQWAEAISYKNKELL